MGRVLSALFNRAPQSPSRSFFSPRKSRQQIARNSCSSECAESFPSPSIRSRLGGRSKTCCRGRDRSSSRLFGSGCANRRLHIVLHRFEALKVSPQGLQIVVRHLRVILPRHGRENRAAVGSPPGAKGANKQCLGVLLGDTGFRIGGQVRGIGDSPRAMKGGRTSGADNLARL